MPVLNNVSFVPYGAHSSINALRGVSTAYNVDNIVTYVLGSGATNDGGQGHFYFVGASQAADNNVNVIAPTGAGQTGRWLRLGTLAPTAGAGLSGVYGVTSSAYTMYGETFLTLSGTAPLQTVTFASTTGLAGSRLFVKQLGTGQTTFLAQPGDNFFDNTGLANVINFTQTGRGYEFQVTTGVIYTIATTKY